MRNFLKKHPSFININNCIDIDIFLQDNHFEQVEPTRLQIHLANH